MDCEVVRNSFATECFRDVADEDYVSARIAYRVGFMNHFLWSALQALEKYLKAFLLINETSTIGINHNLLEAYRRAEKVPKLGFSLPPQELHLFKHLAAHGANRYLEINVYTRGDELPLLDSLVWLTRRYCQPLNYSLKMMNGQYEDLLPSNLQMISSQLFMSYPYKFRVIGGVLKKILAKSAKDQMRKSLIWGNRFYGPGRSLNLRRSHSVNPFHLRHLSEVECLKPFVQLPKGPVSKGKALIIQGQRIVPSSFELTATRGARPSSNSRS